MIDKLHDEHFHLMVSVWPYFRPGSATYDEFDKNGWFIAKTLTGGFHPVGQALYDPTNPEARAAVLGEHQHSALSKRRGRVVARHR